MVDIFNLRAKPDLNSLCCSPSPKCQKNIQHVGGPLESWGVMGWQSLSPKKFLAHNFFQNFFRIFLTPDSDSASVRVP